MQEIEIKLGFDLDNTETTKQALTELYGCPSQQKNLKNTYFDTPAGDLRKMGWSLRLRDKEGSCEQTVKGKGIVQSGLHQRFEINQATEHAELDILKLADIPEIQPFLRQIRPVFSTNFARMSWDIKASSSAVELAMDCGAINSPKADDGIQSSVRSIAEMEIELKSGVTGDLFAVAQKITAKIPCWLYSDSKAKRGYELIGEGEKPSVGHVACASLSDWVSVAGSYAQQLTAAEASDQVCADQLQSLLSQLEMLTAICPAEQNRVKCAAKQLIAAFRPALVNQSDLVTTTKLRQLVTKSTFLGTLGVLVVKSEFQ